MKSLSIVLLICVSAFGVTACTSSQQSQKEDVQTVAAEPSASPEQVEAEIIELENQWVAAIVNKDAAALDSILAVEFNGTSPTASTFPKSEAIEEIKSGAYDVQKMELDEVSVNVYGDTAVAFTSQKEVSKYRGKDNSGHYHFTNVWVKKDGKWQVVASHGSPYQN
jgi:ketosteroid isomerase-like protein